MISSTNTQYDKLIKLVKLMRQLKKYKGALFIYALQDKGSVNGSKDKKLKQYGYKENLKGISELGNLSPQGLMNSSLITYHPYINLFRQWPRITALLHAKNIVGLEDQMANLVAEYEWLRTKLKYPPLSEKVRRFEKNTTNHLKESKAYLAKFFLVDTHFAFYHINIVFSDTVNNAEQLENALIHIKSFRTKLLSQLKNQRLIDSHSRYLWKVIVVKGKLVWHCLIVKRLLSQKNIDASIIEEKEALIKQIQQSARITKVEIEQTLDIQIKITKDSKDDKRKQFNLYLQNYFNQDFWFPYYQIPCKQPKKMLFDKGNDKEE
ncbi:hypothetical protein MTZ49_07320 [Entomomonas sp. E2T0]|uniref:hypothetical protein n=1 Tax=Entomomonas sp. E2T0 TaxID=2930213 RepID=UPI0022281988|nr:hypothetical protein [Entomomonas sp. E2T0]UYZ85349.1 hypothetical protein MTZ49_07320 [Entomomonas sp. E2T0]